MRISISVNETLLEIADRIARQMGVSRSRLFSLAVQDYLSRQDRDEMLEQLNRVYGEHPVWSDRQKMKGIKSKFGSMLKGRGDGNSP